MAEIIKFSTFKQANDLTPNEVLERSMDKYEDVLVIGWSTKPDQILLWDGSKELTREAALYLIRKFERILLD